MTAAEDSPKATCLLIMLPMLATAAFERLYNHLIDPEAAVFVAGFHVHHLFFGLLLAIPASFIIAFRPERSLTRRSALIALGAGVGFVLDEFVAMIVTDMSTPAYLSRVSWLGAAASAAAASLMLSVLAAVKSRRGEAGKQRG